MAALKLRNLNKRNIDPAAITYAAAFNGSSWREHWSAEDARKRLDDFSRTPGYIGKILLNDENQAVALGVGVVENWDGLKKFEFKELCVDPDQAGYGNGHKIVDAIITEAFNAGAKEIYLRTQVASPAARLLSQYGFIQRNNEIIMSLKI